MAKELMVEAVASKKAVKYEAGVESVMS